MVHGRGVEGMCRGLDWLGIQQWLDNEHLEIFRIERAVQVVCDFFGFNPRGDGETDRWKGQSFGWPELMDGCQLW